MSILLTQPPKNPSVSKSGLALWLDGKDFTNSPPTTTWKDKSGGTLYSYNNVLLGADMNPSTWATYWSAYGTGYTGFGLTGSYGYVSCTLASDGIQQGYTSISGHKYYFRFTMKADVACTGGYGFATSGVGSQVNTASVGTSDTLISGLVTPSTSYASVVFGRPSNSTNKIYLKGGVLLVDLTTVFGSGLEPSQAWCDANLAFTFNSTYATVNKGNDATPSNFAYEYNAPSNIIADFTNKTTGNTTTNPNIIKIAGTSSGNANTALLVPSAFTYETGGYTDIQSLNSISKTTSETRNGYIAQVFFQFNLVAVVENQMGTIPTSDGTTASKVAWLKSHIKQIAFNWYGYGSGPSGNSVYVDCWGSGGYWTLKNAGTSANLKNTVNYPSLLTYSFTSVSDKIDSNGYSYFLAYTEASNGTIGSTVISDYANLVITLLDPSSGSDGNGGVVLDGIDDYLTLQPIYLGSSDFTMYMDLVFKSYPSISGLVCLRTTVASNCSYYWYYRNDTGLLQFCYSTDGQIVTGLNYNTTLALNTRYRLAVKRQGTMMYMYVNGVCVSTLNMGSNVSFYASTDVFQIGALKSTTPGYFSNMNVYRLLVYKRCLSDIELSKINNIR